VDNPSRLRIHPAFVSPDPRRPAFFDGLNEESATLTLQCVCCSAAISMGVLEFIHQASVWFRALPALEQTQVLEFYGCRRSSWRGHPVIDSHDDGEPYFGLATCSSCKSQYLLYISFHEYQPARYVATFQGAAIVQLLTRPMEVLTKPLL
jgi:hypothetical protein